jgi:hypothetical protein
MKLMGNEKLVFFLVSTYFDEFDDDEAGCLTLHFVVTPEVRKVLLAGLNCLKKLKEQDAIDAALSVNVPCAIYNTIEEDFESSGREMMNKYRYGVLVERFPEPPKAKVWGGADYSVTLTIRLPQPDTTEQPSTITISYESVVTRWETTSFFLNDLARSIVETLL